MEIETVELVDCPACGLPAEVGGRLGLRTAAGAVEVLRVECVAFHLFLLPSGPPGEEAGRAGRGASGGMSPPTELPRPPEAPDRTGEPRSLRAAAPWLAAVLLLVVISAGAVAAAHSLLP